MADANSEANLDAMMGGAVKLVQSAKGYRAGMDAALLAAACDATGGEIVLEAGCGAGAVLLMAAVRSPEAKFVGIERDPEALALAAQNVALNELAQRIEVEAGDVARLAARGDYDLALANPPFFDDERALRGPAPERRGAWITAEGLEAWTEALTKAVREGGRVIVIHRADRLADLLGLLGRRSGSFQIRPIHPFADAPAGRVIVRATRAGKAPLKLLPPLILHPRKGGKHTAEAEAILRGEARLNWA
jgi:tRNA1(Val) A37 N6-methylase TrmN6